MNTQPSNPFGGGFSIKPIGQSQPVSSAGVWQFFIAALTLYLIMKHVPDGVEIGVILLFGVFLSTPSAVKLLPSILAFIQSPSL